MFQNGTHRSADVADDGLILLDLRVLGAAQRRVDLVPALQLQLLHHALHLVLGDAGHAAEGALAVEVAQPPLVHIVQVVGAHLLRA